MSKNRFGKLISNNKTKFNFSYSGRVYVIAFTEQSEIGVDIEKINYKINLNFIEYVMTKREVDFILTAENQINYYRFYLFWTLKEAYLKYLGMGLIDNLNELDIIKTLNENKVSFKFLMFEDYIISIVSK
ncbi:4'-phosphopantetheinyl transferase family protein [Staphylococcus caprae]|uniref:4'-phosphopantetheinyl transferase family protein n=1 Tax=Staphylococcus caprae TaxID=29380 RepID=UPI003B20F281